MIQVNFFLSINDPFYFVVFQAGWLEVRKLRGGTLQIIERNATA